MGSHGYKLMHLEHLMLATCRVDVSAHRTSNGDIPAHHFGEEGFDYAPGAVGARPEQPTVKKRPSCANRDDSTLRRHLLSVASSNRLAKAKFSVKVTVVM